MKILLLGAEHRAARELSALLEPSGFELQSIELPSLEEALPEAILEETARATPDVVFFSPTVPLHRLFFRRRLHLIDAASKLCAALPRENVVLIHLSNARVYDGKLERAYSEQDRPVPVGDFAKVWRRWEVVIEKQFSQHLILRPSWILQHEGVYLSSELQQVIGDHGAPDKVPNARSNPMSPEDVARMVLALIKQIEVGANNYGVFHIGGSEVLSSTRVLEKLAPESYLRVDEHRPALNYELNCQKILNAFGIQSRVW